MELNSFFSFIIPKENKFFPLIIEVGDKCAEVSEYLVQFMNESDKAKAKEIYLKIKQCEIVGDTLIDNIFNELNDTFITPFDREDIHDLCETLDDVIDYITSSAKRVVLFQPRFVPELTKELAENIRQGCLAIQIAMRELKTISKKPTLALEQCGILHDLEHQADDMYECFVTDLFKEETDSIELIKNKEIMQELEKTTDKAKVVGKILKTIIVKYA